MKLTPVLQVIVAVSVVAAGAGCGSGEAVDCNFAGPASAVVGGGTTQTGFLNLSDGDEMNVTLGPQGLYMVTPSIRIQNMWPGKSGRSGNPNDPEILTELYLGGDLIGGSARANLGMNRTADGGAQLLGMFSPFLQELQLTDYLGQTVTVRGEVADACGRQASDELDVLVTQ